MRGHDGSASIKVIQNGQVIEAIRKDVDGIDFLGNDCVAQFECPNISIITRTFSASQKHIRRHRHTSPAPTAPAIRACGHGESCEWK